MSTTQMVNEAHNPSEHEEKILQLFVEGRPDEPWGRLTNGIIREETGLSDGSIDKALNSLVSAGWVSKRHRGAYELEYSEWDES